MYKMRDGWTDERMDDFRDEVNRRFDKFEGDVDRRFDAVDKRFDKVDKRFDKVEGEVRDLRSEMKSGFEGLYRAQFVVGGGIVAALLGVIATQL
jgi:hypothetical protein